MANKRQPAADQQPSKPPRKREYRCRRINADSSIVCTRLLFIAALPDGVTIEIQCTKCGRIAHVTNKWPMPEAKPIAPA
jgi:hypothetical protein